MIYILFFMKTSAEMGQSLTSQTRIREIPELKFKLNPLTLNKSRQHLEHVFLFLAENKTWNLFQVFFRCMTNFHFTLSFQS